MGGSDPCGAAAFFGGVPRRISYDSLKIAVAKALGRRSRKLTDAFLRIKTDTVGSWHGHRTWLVDGTGVSMPDTPDLQRAFGQPTNQAVGCGFPVARVLAPFHAGTDLIQQAQVAPLRSHEMSRVAGLHPALQAGDVLVGDRACGTFAHPALLGGRRRRGISRMSQRRAVDFAPGRPRPPRRDTGKLTGKARPQWARAPGPEDQVVAWYKPYARPAWMTAEQHDAPPETLTVRECRYRLSRPGFRDSDPRGRRSAGSRLRERPRLYRLVLWRSLPSGR